MPAVWLEETELDLLRLAADPSYDPVIVELHAGELERALAAYAATADPRNAAADTIAWNWCRMPAGVDGDPAGARRVVVIGPVTRHLEDWLGGELAAPPAGVGAREAPARALS